MTNAVVLERIVGHFEQIAEDGSTERVRIALELRHWQALYAITMREQNPGDILPAILQAIEIAPDEPLEVNVVRYIEHSNPPLPPDLGEIV